MNSTGLGSPAGLEAAILLAGYAFGTMLIDVRLCGLVTTREDMLTALRRRSATKNRTGSGQRGAVPTAVLVPEEEGGAVVGLAADVAHVDREWLA